MTEKYKPLNSCTGAGNRLQNIIHSNSIQKMKCHFKKKKRAIDDNVTCIRSKVPTIYWLFFNSRLSSNAQRSDTYENTGLVEAEVSSIKSLIEH